MHARFDAVYPRRRQCTDRWLGIELVALCYSAPQGHCETLKHWPLIKENRQPGVSKIYIRCRISRPKNMQMVTLTSNEFLNSAISGCLRRGMKKMRRGDR
jgi:hypothetical protein